MSRVLFDHPKLIHQAHIAKNCSPFCYLKTYKGIERSISDLLEVQWSNLPSGTLQLLALLALLQIRSQHKIC